MIGVRGHDVDKRNAKELADAIRLLGLECVQLVPYKSIEHFSDKQGMVQPEEVLEIGKVFSDVSIKISMIGSYFNLLDESIYEEHVNRYIEYIRFAKLYGTTIVGTETGSYNKDWSYHKHNHGQVALDQVVDIVKQLVEEAEKHDINVGIEAAYAHVVSTPERIRYLLDKVDSDHLCIIFDPVNLLSMDNYSECSDIIERSFQLFGNRISVLHAKDFVVKDGQIELVPLGQGLMNYVKLFKQVSLQNRDIDIIIEGMTGEMLLESIRYLKKFL